MTKQEKEQLQLLRLKEKTASDIALALHLSVNTVRSHIRRHPLPNTVIVSCKHCGKNIVQIKGTKTKKFCSDSCRNAWWNTHQANINKKAFYHITCEQCGKEFDSYGNKNRKYCSRACYGNARRTHSL